MERLEADRRVLHQVDQAEQIAKVLDRPVLVRGVAVAARVALVRPRALRTADRTRDLQSMWCGQGCE